LLTCAVHAACDVICGCGADGADDELADAHADGAHKEQVAAAELLNEVETGEGGRDIDTVGDDGDDEWVLEAGAEEVLGSVAGDPCQQKDTKKGFGGGLLENEVHASELLQSLEAASGKQTLAYSTFEAVDVGSFAQAELVLVIGLNLTKLFGNGGILDGQLAEP